MKSKISQAAKKSVSLLLAILMMFSMLTVGLTVTVNAADPTYYYASHYDGSNHFKAMSADKKHPGSYVIYVGIEDADKNDTGKGFLNGDRKFKIADVDNDSNNNLNNATHCVNHNINTDNNYTNYSAHIQKSSSLSNTIDFYMSTSSLNDLYIRQKGTETATTEQNFYIQYTPSDDNNGLNGTIKIWSKSDYEDESTTTKYTVTAGETTHGQIVLPENTSVAAGDNVSFTVTADSGYQIGTVKVTKSDNTEVSVTPGENGEYSFTMPESDVTINATFNKMFYLEYYDSDHRYIEPTSISDDGIVTWETKFDFGNFSTNGRFRITNTKTWSGDSNAYQFCVPAYKKNNQKVTSTYIKVTASGVSYEEDGTNIREDNGNTGSYGVSYYNDIILYGVDTSKTYVVTYNPNAEGAVNELDGQITISDKETSPSLTLSQTTATLSVGDTLQLSVTHNNCGGTVTYDSNAEGVATVDANTGLVTAVANGTATITATCSKGETATCKVTVAAPVLKTPKIKADAYVYPGSKVTVALDNQKDFGTVNANNGKKYDNVKNVSFEYTVTPSVETTATSTGKLLQTDGSNTLDSIEFTASQTEGTSYTIKVTASADNFTSATSAEITVTVSKIPFKTENRIYAYAGAIADGSTPALNSWVAAETNTSTKLQVYSNDQKDGGKVVNYPNLGSSNDTDLRIFLPSTVTGDTVALFNSYSDNLVVKNAAANGSDDVTIAPNSYGNVKFTDGTALNITIGSASKTLTLYKSDADSAVYLNHTGTYAGMDDTETNVPKMITRLYTNKDTGALDSDNYGAVADSNGIKDVAVKKIKGRGNSTWKYTDKKSFNVSYSSAVKIGNVTSKKFSFLANYKDPSLSRNRILYALGDYMGVTYSPDVATVDLYMNGLYMGAYLACEKVDVGSSTLISDITELDVENATLESIANGFDFVMELDTSPASDDYNISLGDGRYLTMKTPEYFSSDLGTAYSKNVDDAIKAYIKDKYDKLKTALEGSDKAPLEEIIDIDSLAKFYLLNELAKNCDIGVASTYFTFKNGKFYASPVWDLDMTAANGEKGSNNADYVGYEGNWTAYNSNVNLIMKAAFNNAYVQSAARKIWVESYYTNLLKELTVTDNGTTIADKALNNKKAFKNNFTKWTYPNGFNGFEDNIQFRTQLTTASYDVVNHSYSTASSNTDYNKDYEGQINFVLDWLKSRAAWMTNKYNTYTVGGLNSWGSDDANDKKVMENKGNGTHILTFTSDVRSEHGIKIYSDATITNGIDTPQDKSHACITYDTSVQVIDNSANGTISAPAGENKNMALNVTATADAPVYLIYDQVKNTVTLSDTVTTSSNPTVALEGSTVANEDIKDGTSVTLTATVTPATNNNEVVAGKYTVTLYRGSVTVGAPQTVTFADTDTATTEKQVSFNTKLASKNDSFHVVVTKDSYSVTSASVVYKQSGLKDIKIYFDPSEVWLDALTIDSTVTATVGTKTFKMSIDPDDDNALAKGVFRAMIDSETLDLIKNNNVSFTLDDSDKTAITANADSNVTDGMIYTHDNDNGSKWCQYNTAVEAAYPDGRETYEQFVTYLREQKANNTDNIVYFDNSASKWYNVFIYCWDQDGNFEYAAPLKKLPYADIWYYDFGKTTNRTTRFLFKDRSTNAYGTDYQQTVDLVDGFVKNGNGDPVNVYFARTISKPNPIFITANFYKCTQQNGTGYLKFRAFNTEWKEFIDVIDAQVKTKAVTVYFDMHTKDVADVQLYHTSTDSTYTFASTFTRLTPLPGSKIYSATMQLPYKVVNGSITPVFTFDKFIIGKETTVYPMSSAVQPKADCFTTGEVWYEYNGTTPPNGKSVVSTSANAKTLVATSANVSLAATGADTYNLVAAGTKVYLKPSGNWANNDERYAICVKTEDNNTESWANMTKVEDGVYEATIPEGTWSKLIICRMNGTSTENNWNYCWLRSSEITDTASMYNCLSINNSNETWSVYTQGSSGGTTPTPSIDNFTADNTTITLSGDPASASATLSISVSNGNVNDVTYSVKRDSENVSEGFTIVPNGTTATFTATVAGSYEVTASVDGAVSKTVTITVNAPAEDVYRVAGDSSLCDTNWDANDNNNKMTYNSSTGLYEKVYENVSVGNYQYKIVKNGRDWIPEGNNQIVEVVNANSTVTVWYNAETGEIGAEVSGGTQPPTYSVTLNTTSLSLDLKGTTSAKLTATPTGFTQKATVTWHSENEAVAKVDNGDVTAVGVGTTTIIVTYQEGGNTKTAFCNVTVTDSSVPTVDYCGILGYTHSTATFESTTGGKIDSVKVVLKGAYNTADAYETGYATTTDGVTTIIYAIPTEKTGATTVYKSTTSTTDNNLKFNEWTKNGAFLTPVQDLKTDSVTTTNIEKYVANWSEKVKVKYTFTYKYWDQDKSKGMEYNPEKNPDNLIVKEYKVTVMLDENPTNDVIIAAFRANAPKLSSDYYNYSFDSVAVTVNDDKTASATAAKTVKQYSVTIQDGDGEPTILNTKYYYQNLVTLTAQGTPAQGYRFVWKYAGTKNVIGYGNSISIRITGNLNVAYDQVKTSPAPSDYTILHKPTYEFFTSGDVEKVRFNFRVENTVVDKDNFEEFGILYFFTDEKGVNSNVYADANVPAEKLTDLVLGNTKLSDVKVKKIEKYNSKNQYIFNAAMTNSDANLEKYVRVYSYIKFKDGTDDNGNPIYRVVLSDTITPVIGSLKEARLS